MSRIFKETAKQPNPVQLMNLIGNRNYDRAVWAFCNHKSRINAAQARILETEKAYRSAHQAASQAVSHTANQAAHQAAKQTAYRSVHQAANQAAQASVYTSALLMSFRTTLLINKYS